MTENNKNLTKRIMRRVYGIWFLRQMVPALVGIPVLLIVAFWQIARTFFVSKIVENFINSFHSGSISTIMNFTGSALYDATEHFLSVLVAGLSIGLVLILGYKLARNLTQFTLVRM